MTDVKDQPDPSDIQPVVDNQPPLALPEEEQKNQSQTFSSPPLPQQQPQWMLMPSYPQAVLVSHHMMYALPPPVYLPYNQNSNHHHNQNPKSRRKKYKNTSNDEKRTIWIGDLQYWMDENYLHFSFASAGEMVSVKVIRNKHTGLSEGYGFVEFRSHHVADKVLKEFNGTTMPYTDKPFLLKWASSSSEKHLEKNEHGLSIFVGDLAPDVTDSLLHNTFSEMYPSVKAARVVIDAYTGISKGFGFVSFGDGNERTKAITEMQGVKCSGKAMRVGPATPKDATSSTGLPQQDSYMTNGAMACSAGDSLYATIFVGGLDPSVTDEELKQPFSAYGEIISVNIPLGKACGFVQFVKRQNAEEALKKLNGTVIGKQPVRLTWAVNKLPTNKYGNQSSVAYYGGHYYNGYGYVLLQPHDPMMYAAAPYGGYPVYGSPQQQQVSRGN